MTLVSEHENNDVIAHSAAQDATLASREADSWRIDRPAGYLEPPPAVRRDAAVAGSSAIQPTLEMAASPVNPDSDPGAPETHFGTEKL
jgi:hypothetical protein